MANLIADPAEPDSSRLATRLQVTQAKAYGSCEETQWSPRNQPGNWLLVPPPFRLGLQYGSEVKLAVSAHSLHAKCRLENLARTSQVTRYPAPVILHILKMK
jgi:hypothetical protein